MPFLSDAQIFQLRRELEDTNAEILAWGSDGYVESLTRWSEACEKEAGAVVCASSTQEVSRVVRFSKKHHIPFVVQVGGHSTSGSSSTHGGIVINLSKMSKVVVDPASQTVAVQGGATWSDVDVATARHKLAVVGATSHLTGVAATTLGGGFGWLTGRYGLITDNLLSVRIVLADGSIHDASVDENPGLFWAVRGAGQAFGVVTELVFRAHHQKAPVFGGLLKFPGEKLEEVVAFANIFDRKADKDQGLYFGFTCSCSSLETEIFAVLFYNGPRSEAEEFFSPLLLLEPTANEISMMPYEDLNAVVGNIAASTGRKSLAGTNVTFPLRAEALREVFDQFDMILQTNKGVEELLLTIELLPYAEILKVPIEATACANRGRYYNVSIIFCWHDSDQDAKMHLLQQALVKKVSECAGLERLDAYQEAEGVRLYPNYAGHGESASHLFGDNLPRLQALKRKYDPDNVFKKWHNLLSHRGTSF